LAVAGMVLIDPLLVWSVGWWLSVGATFGIALLASPLAARLPGPRALAQALAVTVAAQVGVAPVAVTAFGGSRWRRCRRTCWPFLWRDRS
jgi:competence protein ComEC